MNSFRRTKEVKEAAKKDHSTVKRAALVLLILLMFGGTFGWAMMHREDPRMAKVQEVRAQLKAEGMTWEQRREIFGQLTPEVRELLWADRMKEREERDKKEMREFFAMPKEQQIAALDKQIDRMNSGRGRGRGGPGGGGGFGQGGPGGGGGAPRQQSFGRDSTTGQASATNRAKGYLDRTDPDTRAQKAEYRRMMVDRRNQRG